jgi:hypothetical protein
MKSTVERDGIIVLDDVQLKTVGNRIVGGNFSDTVELTGGVISVVGTVLGACYWLANPENRKAAWEVFMSNFKRTTVAAVTTAAAVSQVTPTTAVNDLESIDSVLDGSSTNSQAFMSCLQIIDDPNE